MRTLHTYVSTTVETGGQVKNGSLLKRNQTTLLESGENNVHAYFLFLQAQSRLELSLTATC